MPKVLIVGHLTLDAVCNQVTRAASFDLPQGAALGSAVAAASTGAAVDIVAIVGADYPSDVFNTLEQADIGTRYVEKSASSTLRFWVLRETDSLCIDYPYYSTSIPAYTPPPSCVPAEQLCNYSAAHICPMPLEAQLTWVSYLRNHVRLISVDPQPFRFSALGANTENSFSRLIGMVDVLSISLEDFPNLGAGSVSSTLAELLDKGPKVVTLKMGAQGSAIGIQSERSYLSVAAVSGSIGDETGAGDAYAGAFVASYSLTEDLLASGRRAAAAAYVTIKEVGVLHVLDSLDEINVLGNEGTRAVPVKLKVT